MVKPLDDAKPSAKDKLYDVDAAYLPPGERQSDKATGPRMPAACVLKTYHLVGFPLLRCYLSQVQLLLLVASSTPARAVRSTNRLAPFVSGTRNACNVSSRNQLPAQRRQNCRAKTHLANLHGRSHRHECCSLGLPLEILASRVSSL